MALNRRVEAVMGTCGADRSETDSVPVELEIDVYRLPFGRHPERLVEAQRTVERGGTIDIGAEQDHLGFTKFPYGCDLGSRIQHLSKSRRKRLRLTLLAELTTEEPSVITGKLDDSLTEGLRDRRGRTAGQQPT